MKQPTQISYNEWVARFQPRTEEQDRDALIQFETYEPDIETVDVAHAQRRAWTQVDCDGKPVIIFGKAWVNREVFYICEVPVPEGEDYEVVDDIWQVEVLLGTDELEERYQYGTLTDDDLANVDVRRFTSAEARDAFLDGLELHYTNHGGFYAVLKNEVV